MDENHLGATLRTDDDRWQDKASSTSRPIVTWGMYPGVKLYV